MVDNLAVIGERNEVRGGDGKEEENGNGDEERRRDVAIRRLKDSKIGRLKRNTTESRWHRENRDSGSSPE